MPPTAPHHTSPRPPWRAKGLMLRHALLVPLLLATAAIACDVSGLDERLTAMFFNSATQHFPARDWAALELIGHRIAKSALWIVWLLLAATVAASYRVESLRPHRAVLWTTTIAMALGPLVVVFLKDANAIHCPWDLKRFGGTADASYAWFVAPADVGHCFPSGHAAGGFSLAALYFAGATMGSARLQRTALALALSVGTLFSAVRVMQGAHFASHNLWAAAIDWALAACAFVVLLGLTERDAASVQYTGNAA